MIGASPADEATRDQPDPVARIPGLTELLVGRELRGAHPLGHDVELGLVEVRRTAGCEPAPGRAPSKLRVPASLERKPVGSVKRTPVASAHPGDPPADGRAGPVGTTTKRMMLFAGRAIPTLAAAIADELGVELGAVTLKTFSAGEVYCRYDESVRGADVFIVQPTCDNPETGVRTNDALMELLLLIDAAVGASAHRVIAVMPWFGYSRQDKKSALREPISARLVAHVLETAGADRVLTVDLHAGQIQGFFTKPVDHVTALLLLADYFADLQLDDLVVVSPDVGRVKLNHKFADKLGADLALMTKERPAQQVAEIGYVIGDVKGKTALIVDDIIDTAGTLRAAGADGARRGRRARLRRGDARAVLGQRLRDPRRRAVRADRRHRHGPAARRARRTTSSSLSLAGAARRFDQADLHRRLGAARSFSGENQLF